MQGDYTYYLLSAKKPLIGVNKVYNNEFNKKKRS